MLNVAPTSQVPSELRSLHNWVLYGSNKFPYQISGEPAKSTDPQTWTHYDTAKQHAWMFDGIGCVITAPFAGIDFHMVCDPTLIST